MKLYREVHNHEIGDISHHTVGSTDISYVTYICGIVCVFVKIGKNLICR
jgi:hypothetical protein